MIYKECVCELSASLNCRIPNVLSRVILYMHGDKCVHLHPHFALKIGLTQIDLESLLHATM